MERLEGGSRWTLWKRVAAKFRKHAEESSLRDIQRESLAPDPDHRKDCRQNPFRCRQYSRHHLRIARRQRHWRGCAAIRPAPRILRNCRLRFLMLFSIHRRGGCLESACETNGPEARSRSMPRQVLRVRQSWFNATTVLVVATAIVLMLGLSVAPNLHERLHPTAASLHECAVTLIASGSCHYNAAAPLMIAPTTALHFSKIPALTPQWVESPFLAARIFEHAPPAYS